MDPNSSMFGMGGRIPITTYYRTISVDNKPTTVIIGPSKYILPYMTTYYRTISVDNKPTTVIIGPSKYMLPYITTEGSTANCSTL